MTKTYYSILCLALPALVFHSSVNAQERTAGGAMDTQMTWTALSTMAKAANDKADMVDARVDQVVVCGRKGMNYAPGSTGADTEGCVPGVTNPATQTTINSILNCNASGQVYSQTSRTCIRATATAPNCTIQMSLGVHGGGRSQGAPNCPSGYSVVYTGASGGSSGCNTDNGSCHDSRYYLCYRALCQ